MAKSQKEFKMQEITSPDNNLMYTVVAFRYGNKEKHSYTVAITSDFDKAKDYANQEEEYRGGKYACVIEQVVLDKYSQDSDEGSFITYETPAYIEYQKTIVERSLQKFKNLAYYRSLEEYLKDLRTTIEKQEMEQVDEFKGSQKIKKDDILKQLNFIITREGSLARAHKRVMVGKE